MLLLEIFEFFSIVSTFTYIFYLKVLWKNNSIIWSKNYTDYSLKSNKLGKVGFTSFRLAALDFIYKKFKKKVERL